MKFAYASTFSVNLVKSVTSHNAFLCKVAY